jgi:hypothetical protein
VKKILLLFLSITLVAGLFAGCGGKKGPGDKPAQAKKSRVFKPNELLSQEEATEIVGQVLVLDESSLEIDGETGISSTYYVYDIDEYTTLHALFMLRQNGAIPKEDFEDGITVKSAYESELKFCGDKAEPIKGLGDKAYFHKDYAQVGVLYGDYFFIVAFGSYSHDFEEAKETSLKIARKILENIKKK